MKIIHFSDPHGGGAAEDWMAYFDNAGWGFSTTVSGGDSGTIYPNCKMQ